MNKKILAHIHKMDAETCNILLPFFANPSSDEWIRDVLAAYFSYFLKIGGKAETDRAATRELRSSLKVLVPAGSRRSLEKMEAFLSDEFHRKGYSFMGGKTRPYYGPYIWKRTEKRVFDVELTDRHIQVNAFFLYDFILQSWMRFQTFGRTGTGGWVKWGAEGWQDGLYCVAATYDLEHLDDDLTFQVSFLKHEGRHFADKEDFPGISNIDLEYRAKLTELIYCPEMKYRFEPILQEAAPIKADPHRYAAYTILKALSERIFSRPYVKEERLWQSVPYEQIQVEARKLLQADTERLRKK